MAGINQEVIWGSMKDYILAFLTVENQLSDVSYSFALQVHVK